MTRSKRRYVGAFGDLATRTSVYERDNALEVDEQDAFHIRRRRVFFEDVLLVTLHDSISLLGIFTPFGVSSVLFLIAIAIGHEGGWITAAFALPFIAYGVARMAIRDAIITVFGRRSRARIRFTLRRRKAQRTYEELCEKIRKAQEVPAPPEP